MKKVFFCTIFYTLSLCNCIQAQIENKTVGICHKNKYKILPIGFFTPETQIAVGGLFYTMFCLAKNDSIVKRSNIQSYLTITQRRQFSFENQWDIYGRENSYYFTGELDYTRFPEFFYGIGNFTKEESKQLYSFDRIKLISKNTKQISSSIYLGFQLNIQKLFNVNNENVDLMKSERVSGANGYLLVGIGPVFIRDKRNNILNSTIGSYLESHILVNNYGILHENQSINLTIDFRKYFTFANHNTIAFHNYLSFNEGVVPFREMPAIGGARYLRGYYSGRFRDNNLYILQVEYRRKIVGRFGFAFFTGIGEVAKSIQEFTGYGIKMNYGMGLRYKVNKAENVNIRLDYGITSDNTHGLYIVFAEAF